MFKFQVSALVSVLLIIGTLLKRVESLQCYTCTKSVSDDCNDPFNPIAGHSFGGECQNAELVCLKEKIPATYLQPQDVRRGCVTEDFCRTREMATELCLTCDSHLCNTSDKLTVSTYSFIVTLLLQYFLVK